MTATKLIAASAAVLAAAACAAMPGAEDDADTAVLSAEDAAPAMAAVEEDVVVTVATADAFAGVLADPRRDDDRARDGERNPAETLAFFDIQPDHTVVEALPGGGWYTRVLLPYVGETGAYYGANYSADTFKTLFGDRLTEERLASFKAWPDTFPGQIEESLGMRPDGAFTLAGAPEELHGTVDRFVFIRALHNLNRSGDLAGALTTAHTVLKPGGMVGVVQHRAKADAPDDYADGSKGYLREADVIAAFETAGFEYVGASDVNANPADTADHEIGVWMLKPARRGDVDEAERAQLDAIGESDRMTLVFKKPA